MTNALAFPQRRGQPAPYGTRAQLTAQTGDVEGYLAFAAYDRRARVASYALRVVNQSSHPLQARMSCARVRGALDFTPLDVQIAPFSVSETLLPVRLAEVGPYDRAIVKIVGPGVAFSLEAPAPPRSKRRRNGLLTAIAAAIFCVGSAFALVSAEPRLTTLAAPNRAFPGSALDVPYAFSGFGSLRYALQTADGRQLAAGLLTAHQGTLHLTIPPGAGSSVLLDASLAGPLGQTSVERRIELARAANVAKSSKPAASPPHIDELTVASPLVRAGDQLAVKYVTNARTGDIWLIDSAGRLWANVALSLDGQSTLKVPQAAAGREMRIVLHARNGSADAVSSIGILVLPSAIVSQDAIAAPSSATEQLGLNLSSQTAAPGQDVVVTLSGSHGDARVSLTDAAGNTIETGDVPANQNAVTLSAPSVSSTTSYYVVANVSSGNSEQSIVRKLVVTPR